MSIISDVSGLLGNVAKYIRIFLYYEDFTANKSLSDVTKLTRVEPLTIISRDCINLPYLNDVNQDLLSLFSGYYLQAVDMMTKINDVEVVRILDSLNPDRDATGFMLGENRMTSEVSRKSGSFESISLESHMYRLPKRDDGRIVALEATDTSSFKPIDVDKDNVQQLNTISNMSIGKLLTVSVSVSPEAKQNYVVKIPVAVRLIVSLIPNTTITQLLVSKAEDHSFIERFHSWRSGRIGFIKDLIFCQDMIDEHKKAMIEDETGTMQEIIKRVNNAKKFGLLTKNPSMVSASNLFVITESIAKDIEHKIGGKLSSPTVRKKLFDNTYAMIIVVIDREWERITFYTRGIDASTDLSIKEIKSATKGKDGIDIMDLMKSLSSSNPASF